jgi:hypothetical protein
MVRHGRCPLWWPYSFKALRIPFEPYKYKPLLKIRDSPDRQLDTTDEVDSGKTIEASLILAELTPFSLCFSSAHCLLVHQHPARLTGRPGAGGVGSAAGRGDICRAVSPRTSACHQAASKIGPWAQCVNGSTLGPDRIHLLVMSAAASLRPSCKCKHFPARHTRPTPCVERKRRIDIECGAAQNVYGVERHRTSWLHPKTG